MVFKNSVRISRETLCHRYEDHRLMLFTKIISLYSENHTEHTNIVCVQHTGTFNIKPGPPHNLKMVDFSSISLFTVPVGLYWVLVPTFPHESVGPKHVSAGIISYPIHFDPEDGGNIHL
jgi:hypothetical protein